MLPNYNLNTLANRQGPFSDLGVPQNAAFVPLVLSADEQDVHSGMFLDHAANDHYLLAYWTAIWSMPDLYQFFTNPTSVDPSRIPPTTTVTAGGTISSLFLQALNSTPLQLTAESAEFAAYPDYPINSQPQGATFVNNPNLRSCYTGEDTTLPLGFTYNITYVDDVTAAISCTEKGTAAYMAVGAAGATPNQILRVQWPDGWPFQGYIQLQGQVWMPGCAVSINARPHNFPYYDVLQRVQFLPYAQQILQQMQLTREFSQSLDSVEQMAYLVTAIILDRRQKLYMAAMNQT